MKMYNGVQAKSNDLQLSMVELKEKTEFQNNLSIFLEKYAENKDEQMLI